MSKTPKDKTALPDPNDLPKRKLQPTERKPKEDRRHLRHGLTAGQLPAGCVYIQHRCDHLRRQLEDHVLKAKGEIGIADASTINCCVKWERHGNLAQHWLRKQGTKMNNNDVLRFSQEIAAASDKRDKAIRRLQLDRDEQHDIIATLYTEPQQ